MDAPRPHFVLTITFLPDKTGRTDINRLKRLLKSLFRAWHVKVVDARREDAPAPLTLADLEPLEKPVEIG